jgi:glycosyltransferase involved in cell wall biosynthesis
VVQTLHNFRLLCPGALLLRDGRACTDCLGKLPLPAVRHACYRGSRPATAAVAAMLAAHRAMGTWSAAVDRYVALTPFARDLFVRGGLPEEKIAVVPNFLADDPGMGAGGGGYALFVGRLSPEKGVGTLLEAWTRHDPGLPLVIAGDGPLGDAVAEAARVSPAIRWLGRQERPAVLDLMHAADALVLPSLWSENLPLTLVEAYACGTPVVASDHGAMRGLVEDGETGRRFTPEDPAALAASVRAVTGSRAANERLRRAARARFQRLYTAEAHHGLLLELYRDAFVARHGVAVSVATFAV